MCRVGMSGQTGIDRATDFITALNVSGPCESQRPGVYAAAMRCLKDLISETPPA